MSAAYRALPRDLAGPRSPGWWGVVLLIANEAALFGALLTGYFYLRASAPAWPLGGLEPPDLVLPGLNTVLLLTSSAAIAWAEHSVIHDHRGRLRLGLALAFILGAAFVAVQAVEYSRETFAPQVNAYSSLFYTITGFHGAHVAVGLLMLIVVFIRAMRGHFAAGRYEAVSNVAIYWHFVDVVWLAVFTSLYVTPYLR